ncbi:hypothetical protein BDW42DRAFT_188706 [Aspergillus taichungensis]|uniref:Uncharacterized protein n=1 Tax=Aspergillus taichungensis TaxID=482145 RepID=A0A2J5HHE3_9EURO|nr:hypothetical protein BDW42DRAFT_188706 [Aspergillus taichungensis]
MPSRAVNRPVNSKVKEQDINSKLQLFGIYQGFKHGKLPSNKQCDIALNSALASKALSSPSKELSEEGQALVQDVRNVIEEAKKLLLSKNDGQLLQEFIWSANTMSKDDVDGRANVGVTKDGAKQDGQKALEGLKTLGTLLVTNGQFRKLLNDAMIIARDIAGDVSQKAANKVRPSEDQLSQVDEPAEENTWHEAPDFSKHKEQMRSKFKKNKESQASEVADSGVNQATGGQDPSSIAQVDGRAGAQEGAEKTKRKLSDNISESTKSRAREMSGKTKEYLQEKIPQERREQTIWRLKRVVLEIQGHADYQQAIETILSLVEKYGSTSRHASKQGAGMVQGVRGNDKVQTMETNLRVLIERFANSTSLDDLFDSLETIYRDADKDAELKGWFKNMNHFIRKCLQEQGYIVEEDCNREWDQLADHGKYLLRERYRSHTDRVLDEVKFVGDQFTKDPQNRAFRESMEKLFNDLGRDAQGNVAFKKHLLTDIGNVILPGLFENIRYVPVPRIEVMDQMADIVVENLVIESDNLMPNVVEFGSDNYFRWGRKKISSKRDNKIMISVSGIQADLRDVSYYINKKEGFPAVTDMGVMDILLGGEGFGFKIAASTAHKADQQNFVKLDRVTVKIDHLDIKLRKSKHKVLFTLFRPMLHNVVRPVLQKVLEEQVRHAFLRGDSFAREIQAEVKRAEAASLETAQEDPSQLPNIYSRYLDAFRTKMESKKQATQETPKRDTKVQTVFTLHDSMFPDIQLPGGISTKATEYTELAKKGDRWESPIFSIGSAGESTDIPTPATPTRRAHRTADAGLTNGSASTAPQRATNGGITNGGATNGSTKHVTNGATNGATNGRAKAHAYQSRGFKDEVDQAFGSNGTTTMMHDGPTIPGSTTAFNPQAA